jgi:hypothetical protein
MKPEGLFRASGVEKLSTQHGDDTGVQGCLRPAIIRTLYFCRSCCAAFGVTRVVVDGTDVIGDKIRSTIGFMTTLSIRNAHVDQKARC